jgi:hypothetical protein
LRPSVDSGYKIHPDAGEQSGTKLPMGKGIPLIIKEIK